MNVEIKKLYSDDSSESKIIKCENTKELYNYVLTDFLETTLESAREELTENEFTSLCLNVCGFMSEYFT